MRPTSWLAPLILTLAAFDAVAGDLAYVTNQNDSTLSVIDPHLGSEIARISLPGQPAGVSVGRPGELYTVATASRTVRRSNGGPDGAIVAEVQLEGGPMGVAYDAQADRVFVSDWYNARIWVLDGRSLAPQAQLKTGSAPAGLAINGGALASADRDADHVTLFDLETLEPRGTVAVGTRPFGLGFAPDGRLFVGNVGSNDVSVIDPVAGGAPVATVPVGDRPYGVAFAQGHAFVTNQYADTVSVIDLATLEVVATVDVGEYPEGIDTTSDGRRVLVANWFSNTLSVIDAKTLRVINEVPTGDGPRAFGRFIAARGDTK